MKIHRSTVLEQPAPAAPAAPAAPSTVVVHRQNAKDPAKAAALKSKIDALERELEETSRQIKPLQQKYDKITRTLDVLYVDHAHYTNDKAETASPAKVTIHRQNSAYRRGDFVLIKATGNTGVIEAIHTDGTFDVQDKKTGTIKEMTAAEID